MASITTEVIDLTSSDATSARSIATASSSADDADASSSAANITPERRPAKRIRASRRLEARREQQEVEGKKAARKCKNDNDNDEVEDVPKYEAEDTNHVNGYFEVDDILDRRTRKYGSESAGLRQVVEYLVSWKKPANYTGDESLYEPSWLIAENLDQNSLVDAFRKFPTDACPDRSAGSGMQNIKNLKTPENQMGLDNDDFSDDEEEEQSEEEEEEDASDDMQEYEEEEDNGKSSKEDRAKDPDVSHLEDSDYDSPGTVELVLNRRTYRVGQSWVSGTDETFIYTISIIQPIPRKAKCHKYMRMNKTFVCPEGEEDSYVLLSEDVVLDLTLLKVPCKVAFKKFSMRYEQEDENQRSFAYYNETGKILHHPTRPAVLELFAGAGGMSLGLEKYFNVKWVVDNDHMAAATLQANKTNSDVQIYTEDVKTFLRRSFQGNPCYPATGQVDHIHASPPCKGFSRANRSGGKGKNDMMNNKQSLLFIKAIKHFRPKTASFENVPGLVVEEYKGYLQSVVASLLQMGYQVRVKVLSAEKHGDPQKRRRLILFAARSDCKLPDMPPPTHGPGLLPIVTCKDALQIIEQEQPTKSKSSAGTVFVGETVVFLIGNTNDINIM